METTTEIHVPDNCTSTRFDIDGLGFERNAVLSSDDEGAIRETKVISNTGAIVGHFVTHAADFRYRDYGVHLGQIDQLTFIASPAKTIKGLFVDCRERSPTCGKKLTLSFSTSPARKLIIPNGVAHAFEDITHVVTRNDLKLYADPFNTSWSVENDNHTFLLDAGPDQIPKLPVNRYPLPFSAAIMFFRMQQEVMRGGRTRDQKVIEGTIGGAKQAVVLSQEHAASRLELPALPAGPALPGVGFGVNSFFAIAENSWCVLPSTQNFVMDMVMLEVQRGSAAEHALHTRHDVLHTFLDREGCEVRLGLLDLRRDSPTFRDTTELQFRCDPRLHVRIPAGVAYRYRTEGTFTLRVEYELFLDEQEPRQDLPPIGLDRLTIRGGDLILRDGVVTPKIPAPPPALWLLARKELESLGASDY